MRLKNPMAGIAFAFGWGISAPLPNPLESTSPEEIMESKLDASCRVARLEGKYANHLAVGFNAYEFIFDFGQSYSDNGHAELYTRIITCPAHAKELLKILKESVAQYEQEYGPCECK